jgi:hypothetical protein
MRFTIQYIPLSKIRPGADGAVTERIRQLRRLMGDCMHVIAVRPNKADGTYSLLVGRDRYDYLSKHTRKRCAPCIVDREQVLAEGGSLLSAAARLFSPLARSFLLQELEPHCWSIIRTFLRTEPRFRQLSRLEQWKVLLLAIRYRQTVLAFMRHAVDRYAAARISE